MASINNVVTVSLLKPSRRLSDVNMNVCGVITSKLSPLSTAERARVYTDTASVAADFGTRSDVYQHALAFFGTSPNPVNVGGLFVVGYWRAVDEDTDATAATLRGAQLSESAIVGEMQQISDGEMDITVDAALESLTALNFQSVLSLEDIASVIDTALTGATATVDDLGIKITSDTTGATSTLTFASDPATSGTYIGGILGLEDGSGAILAQGVAAGTITAESKVDAITAIYAETGLKGAVFIDKPTDQEAKDLAAWALANDVLLYDVFAQASNFEIDPTNPVWAIKLAGQDAYRCIGSIDNDRRRATTYMARMHTVLFGGENTAITMHLKEGSRPAEAFTQTQITKAKNVGLDIYVATEGKSPDWLTSGANGFTDNVYNLIALKDSLQKAGYNHLNSTTSKIAQTTPGVNSLVDALEKDAKGFIRAGVGAPGTWTSPDSFGDLETFKRSIEQNGYYFLAGRLSDQDPADREARKSPVIQGAFKMAGAIHSANILININY